MPALVEREKISTEMHASLRRHIMHEREKRKQEAAEAEKDFERKAKEEEEKRKKLEEEHSTLENIKEQLVKLEKKQECLRQEKHLLFWQFKKVLHEEDKRKQARLREQSELAMSSSGQFPQHGLALNAHHILPQGYRYQNHPQQQYINQGSHNSPAQPQPLPQGLKRPHSPTPPSSGTLQMHPRQPTTMHSSPQQSGYSGHSSFMSPVHPGPHYSHNVSGASHLASTRKTQDQVPYNNMDERSRSRVTILPPKQPSSPFSTNLQIRSGSPARYIKTEREPASYSPASGSSSPHHKYQATQGGGRNIHQKYQ